MSDKGFVTKGSAEYFAEREAKISAHISEAKSKIDEIEARVRTEIAEIGERRDRLRHHLEGFVAARNELVQHREKTLGLVDELNSIVSVCDQQLPVLDEMLDALEADYRSEDGRLAEAEQSRARQLKKHERKKTRYELRQVRLGLRKKLFFKGEEDADGSSGESAGQ